MNNNYSQLASISGLRSQAMLGVKVVKEQCRGRISDDVSEPVWVRMDDLQIDIQSAMEDTL